MSCRDTTLYDILQVLPTASDAEIKSAYKRLAKEYHPDKNPNATGEEFKEMAYAYEVLSNPQRRAIYDRYGINGLRENGGGPSTSRSSPMDLFENMFNDAFQRQAPPSPFSSIFDMGGTGGLGGSGGLLGGTGLLGSSLFGGSPLAENLLFGSSHRSARSSYRGEPKYHTLNVTLEELYKGGLQAIAINKDVICPGCNGRGSKSGNIYTCKVCRGSGMKMTYRQILPGFSQQTQMKCQDCRATGQVILERDRCSVCHGKKIIKQKKTLDVNVKRGMRNGEHITFRNEGDQKPGIEAGDVIVTLCEQQHSLYKRIGDDLHVKKTISLADALCGFAFCLKQLDGRDLVIRKAPGECTTSGRMSVIGEGMPVHHKRRLNQHHGKGNLFIQFTVQFPENNFASNEQLKVLEQILGPRPAFEMPTGDFEDVTLEDFDPNDRRNHPRQSRRAAREAYHEDEEEAARHHQQGIGCSQQ